MKVMNITINKQAVKAVAAALVFSAISSAAVAQAPAPGAPGAMPFNDLPKVDITLPAPAPLPDPAAKVGQTVISGKEINAFVVSKLPMIEKSYENSLAMKLASVPADKRDMVKKNMLAGIDFSKVVNNIPRELLNKKIQTILLNKFLEKHNAPVDQKALDKVMENIAATAKQTGQTVEAFMKDNGVDKSEIVAGIKFRKLMEENASDANAEKFVKAHPDYFNGTEVTVSHILIQVAPLSSTSELKAAVAKLKALKADIEAGKITFSEAANKNSTCPSGKKDGGKDGKGGFGDLDSFKFAVGKRMMMVPAFAEAAFALKKGQISEPVQTRFGFHLIKCADRVDGKDPQNPAAKDVAKEVLSSNLMMEVFAQTLTDCPIEIYAAKPETKTAKADCKTGCK